MLERATVISVARVTDSGLTVIFRTQSEIEANVVEALLDSHGVQTMRTSGPTPGLFQFRLSPLGETRISVRDEDAADAVRDHRESSRAGRRRDRRAAAAGVRRARSAHRLSIQGSRAARARADAQIQGARGSERRRRRQRVAGVSRRRGARPGRRRGAVSIVPDLQRRPEVEDQSEPGLDGIAGRDGRAARPRRTHDPRPRRGEDRRPAQAGAARRYLRSADCRDLSRWRPRSGAHVSDARVFVGHRGRAAAGLLRPRSQVTAAGTAAGARPAAAVVSGLRRSRPRPSQAVSRRSVRRRRADRAGRRPDEEGSRTGRRASSALDSDYVRRP